MPRRVARLLALVVPLAASSVLAQPQRMQERDCILRAELDGILSSGTAEYLTDAVEAAEREECQALLVVLDTPGGSLEATRAVARAFLNADVPVIVYVAPGGARAGSAGVFVTMAAHVAAMAPGTNIGAAHPVTAGGGDPEEAGGEELARKIENDAAAFARAIAQQRGRNADWAEAAVRESISATAEEAVEEDVVDLIAPSERALLAELDGRTIAGVTLSTDGATLIAFEPTIQQRAMAVLGDPTVVYVLMMIGLLGLLVELTQPGMMVPGAVGVFCLLLAGIGMNVLPVRIGAIALLVIAAALLLAELFVTSYGLLAAGGVVSLVLGSLLLVDTHDPDYFVEPTVRVSWALILPLAGVLALAVGLLARRARELRRKRGSTGREGLVGARGRTDGDVGPRGGHVRVAGERWNAFSRTPIGDREPVEVVDVQGLRLEVTPAGTRKEA